MTCTGQCSGCAYRPGAAANLEPQNKLKGMFAALGGFPFFCHESLGWTHDRKGYPNGDREIEQQLAILCGRAKLIDAGASPDLIAIQTAGIRRDAPTARYRPHSSTTRSLKG